MFAFHGDAVMPRRQPARFLRGVPNALIGIKALTVMKILAPFVLFASLAVSLHAQTIDVGS